MSFRFCVILVGKMLSTNIKVPKLFVTILDYNELYMANFESHKKQLCQPKSIDLLVVVLNMQTGTHLIVVTVKDLH